jgi:hypothetical protein
MIKLRCWLLMLLLSAPCVTFAQSADSLLTKTALTSQDTLTIIDLIDSLLMLEDEASSQLSLRIGYNSNVLEAGRTLGIENFGLAPALSYYHKSGVYADVTGYWSKDFQPKYYLTVASVGYMYDFNKYFSFIAGYDHYFYSDATYIPFQNTLSVTPVVEFKPVSVSLNYSYYFGDQSAHRLMPGLGVTLEKKKFWVFDRIALLPGFYALWGNMTITKIEYVLPDRIIDRINNRIKYGIPEDIVEREETIYGMMNYTFSVPLSITYKNWSLLLTYAYNIPKALEDETLTISESSYVSGSLSYFFDLSSNKKRL